MKKLNHTELKILAKQIRDKLQDQAVIAQKEVNDQADKDNRKAAEAALKQLQRLTPAAQSMVSVRGFGGIEDLTVERILQAMRPKQTKIKVPYEHYRDNCEIFNALIIGQINSPDIESLCNKVAQQFVTTP